METAAVVLLGIAALGGVSLGAWILSGKLPPTGVALLHGLVGAAGFVVLLLAIAKGLPGLASLALAGFLVAAIGGGVLFVGFHLKGKPLPVPLTLAHVLVAAASFVLLLAALL
jgi:hypothetical protein